MLKEFSDKLKKPIAKVRTCLCLLNSHASFFLYENYHVYRKSAKIILHHSFAWVMKKYQASVNFKS